MMDVVPPPSTGPAGPDGGELLDVSALAERCFGDRDLELDLLHLFVAQCREVGKALLVSADAGTIRDAAHALRGSAAAVGADALARALAGLEEAAAAGPVDPDARRDLPALLGATVAAAEAHLAKRGAEAAALAKPDGLA